MSNTPKKQFDLVHVQRFLKWEEQATHGHCYVEYGKMTNMGLRAYVIDLMRKDWHLIECQLRVMVLEDWWEENKPHYRYISLSTDGTSRETEAEELAERARQKMGLEDLDSKIMKEASDLEKGLNFNDLTGDEPPPQIGSDGWAHVIMSAWATMGKPDVPLFTATYATRYAVIAEARAERAEIVIKRQRKIAEEANKLFFQWASIATKAEAKG